MTHSTDQPVGITPGFSTSCPSIRADLAKNPELCEKHITISAQSAPTNEVKNLTWASMAREQHNITFMEFARRGANRLAAMNFRADVPTHVCEDSFEGILEASGLWPMKEELAPHNLALCT